MKVPTSDLGLMMNGLTFSTMEGIVEAEYESSGRAWSAVGASEIDALNALLHAMANDFEFAASAPMTFDIEEFLAEAAGRCDALAWDLEQTTDRLVELEMLNTLMAQQYGDSIAKVIEQRNNARLELADTRIRNAYLEEQLELHREVRV